MNDFNIPEGEQAQPAQVGTPFDQGLEAGLQQFLGEQDLAASAKETGALRRQRGVPSALALLRIVLGYSVLGYSLRLLGIWCTVTEIGYLSKTALLHRLGNCRVWLGKLVLQALLHQKVLLPQKAGVRVKVVDASVLTQPGSRGADWRVHLSLDLGRMVVDEVELTDGRGAERFGRFTFQPGQIGIADRAYALAKSLGHGCAQGAWLVVRTGWNRLALETEAGERFDLIAWLRQQELMPEGPPSEVTVWVRTPPDRFAFRLVAQALPAAAVAKAHRKVRAEAQKNHHTPAEPSLFAAGFILLLTNLPPTDWPMALVLQVYRFRWQVELAFKRLKSLIRLNDLRCKDPDLVQVYLLGKLLGVIFMERIQLQLFACYPDPFHSTQRPVSVWRLTDLLWQQLCQCIRGPLTFDNFLRKWPSLWRYLCDEPRTRQQQSASARDWFRRLSLP